jgi:DNA polymerase III delta prime subunit
VSEDYIPIDNKAALKEERVQDTLSAYIIERTPVGYSYSSLEFGDVYVIKDEEIKKLDKLIEEKNQLPLQKESLGDGYAAAEKEIQEKIDAQKKHLKDNNIYPWYEVNHLYAMESVVSDSALIYEFDFEIYPNYTVKDVHKKMGLSLDPKRYKYFKYFLDQKPVYKSGDWEWEETKNSEFYTAAFAALENEQDYKDKLLLTIIDMTKYIKEKNSFDENDFAKKQMLRWEKDNVQGQLKTISISKLKSSIDTLDGVAMLMGYYMNHDVYTDSIQDKTRFSYSFDLNYVITKVTEQKLGE